MRVPAERCSIALIAILVAATAVRFAGLGSKPLWIDEAMTALVVLGRGPDDVPLGVARPLAALASIFSLNPAATWLDVVTRLVDPAVQHTHPPLFYVLVHAWLAWLAPPLSELAFTLRAVAAVFGVVGNNAWTAWMGELVPSAIRGRFFSRRTVYITIAGTVASLAAGIALDALSARGFKGPSLGALAAVACLAGVVSVYLLRYQHDPQPVRARERRDWRVLIVVMRAAPARPFLWYLLAWNGAVALSASFFSFHMLSNLRTGFAIAALHGVAVAAVRIISAPFWGRAVDRFGARPVLVLCSFGIAAVPAMWLLPTPAFLWPLALEAVLSGTLWGGHGIAAMDLTFQLSPRAERPFYLAVFATAGGLGFAVASMLAGLLASQLPTRFDLAETWTNLHVLFMLSALARLAASILTLRIQEAGARDVRAFVGIVVRGATAALLPRRVAG